MSAPPTAVVYVPVVQAFPVFAGVHAVQTPPQWGKTNFTPELWGIISTSNVYTVRQHLKLLPKACCACPPCVKQPSTFSIYAGPSADSQHELIRIDEVSDDWNRCCCTPYHPFKLEARQFVPMPGDSSLNTDYSFLRQDVRADWERLGDPRSRARWLIDFYKNQPVLFTVQRNGGHRCCFKCPCKLLSCPVLFNCCADGAHIYAGNTPGHPTKPGKEEGLPYPAPAETLIGSVTQPIFGGCCIPFLALRDGPDAAEPFGKTTGPCFFGGWSEMCCDFRFKVSKFTSSRDSADIGMITKRAPVTGAQAAATLCCNGDADIFSMEYNPAAADTTPQQKVVALSSLLMTDYMIFDGQVRMLFFRSAPSHFKLFPSSSSHPKPPFAPHTDAQVGHSRQHAVLLLLLLHGSWAALSLPDLHPSRPAVEKERLGGDFVIFLLFLCCYK